MGATGTAKTCQVTVPTLTSPITGLTMQIHGLNYADEVAVQVNGSAWVNLDNGTVAVASPGSNYGGIGGAYHTLTVTLGLTSTLVKAGLNSIGFRFNGSDGVTSGFRVLGFNFVNAQGATVLPSTAFVADNPVTWTPPLADATDIAAGKNLWLTGKLVENDFPGAPTIKATCSDCHAVDGRDLKYFNYTNYSIEARSIFHGLSTLQGEQIASYIRSLSTPNPGRPWNPPYQPGPGVDEAAASSWSAGAGLTYALANDVQEVPYLFPNGIDEAAVSTSGTLDTREIPIALQLPDWNQWLPHIHPKDAWGSSFTSSAMYTDYTCNSQLTRVLAMVNSSTPPTMAKLQTAFQDWDDDGYSFYLPIAQSPTVDWTPQLSNAVYSTALWQLVKTWELMQTYNLNAYGLTSTSQEKRLWPSGGLFQTSPARIKIPLGANGLTADPIKYEYLNNSWYMLQMITNAGNRQRNGTFPIDWPYFRGRVKDLSDASGVGAGMRLTEVFVKGMQQGDNGLGPLDVTTGWDPSFLGDLADLLSPAVSTVWQGTPASYKGPVLTATINSWLTKNEEYAPALYYDAGDTTENALPDGNLDGGSWLDTVYLAVPYMEPNGVSTQTSNSVAAWGKTMWPLPNWNALL